MHFFQKQLSGPIRYFFPVHYYSILLYMLNSLLKSTELVELDEKIVK